MWALKRRELVSNLWRANKPRSVSFRSVPLFALFGKWHWLAYNLFLCWPNYTLILIHLIFSAHTNTNTQHSTTHTQSYTHTQRKVSSLRRQVEQQQQQQFAVAAHWGRRRQRPQFFSGYWDVRSTYIHYWASSDWYVCRYSHDSLSHSIYVFVHLFSFVLVNCEFCSS